MIHALASVADVAGGALARVHAAVDGRVAELDVRPLRLTTSVFSDVASAEM